MKFTIICLLLFSQFVNIYCHHYSCYISNSYTAYFYTPLPPYSPPRLYSFTPFYTLLHTHIPPLSSIHINLYTIIQPLQCRPYIHHRPLFLYSLNTPFQPTSSYTLLPPPRSLYPLHLYQFPGHQFLYTTPWIYSSLLPGNTSNLSPTLTSLIRGEKTLHSPPWSSRVKLTSLQGLEFTSFAKHRKFGAGMMILT